MQPARRSIAAAIAAAVVSAGSTHAAPAPGDEAAGPEPAPRLAAIAPADDVRKAIVIGAGGEVYEPDGKGAWIHRLPS